MYIYYDKQNNVATKIPHGDIPRQGSDLRFFICFDADRFNEFKNSSVMLEFTSPGDVTGAAKNPEILGGTLLKFQQESFNEITYDLIPGKRYLTYEFLVTKEENKKYGSARVNIRVQENDKNYYLASAEIFIEKTFGYHAPSALDQIEYDEFMAISENINQNLNSEINKRRIFTVDSLPEYVNGEIPDGYKVGDVFILSTNGGIYKVGENFYIEYTNQLISLSEEIDDDNLPILGQITIGDEKWQIKADKAKIVSSMNILSENYEYFTLKLPLQKNTNYVCILETSEGLEEYTFTVNTGSVFTGVSTTVFYYGLIDGDNARLLIQFYFNGDNDKIYFRAYDMMSGLIENNWFGPKISRLDFYRLTY